MTPGRDVVEKVAAMIGAQVNLSHGAQEATYNASDRRLAAAIVDTIYAGLRERVRDRQKVQWATWDGDRWLREADVLALLERP